jgi:hypothetical protein
VSFCAGDVAARYFALTREERAALEAGAELLRNAVEWMEQSRSI